jgi:hypothetical protein
VFHPFDGVLPHPFPRLFLDLQPEILGHALLDAADKDGGRVDALDVGRLISSEQGHAFVGQFPLYLERVERVPAAALDVLTDHSGEPGLGRVRLGQQVGHAPVAGEQAGHDRGRAREGLGGQFGFDGPAFPRVRAGRRVGPGHRRVGHMPAADPAADRGADAPLGSPPSPPVLVRVAGLQGQPDG